MKFSQILNSSLGKKFLMGFTGLIWSGFIVGHLIGNLTLLSSNPDPFNKYAHFLTNLGGLLYLIEFFLAATLLLHLGYAVWLKISYWMARPGRYIKNASAGGASKKSAGSITMIYTGIIIIIFLVIHINNFKFGSVYMTMVDGVQMRDLYRTVYEYYASPFNVVFYVAVMILLGFHLSHGFWSAFQSLGLNGPRFTPLIQGIAILFAIIMAVGFVYIPIHVHIMGGA